MSVRAIGMCELLTRGLVMDRSRQASNKHAAGMQMLDDICHVTLMVYEILARIP